MSSAEIPIPAAHGNRQLYSNARRELGTWLESLYYRGLRLAGIVPEVPSDIREAGARIGRVEGVEKVILIGSWARGHAREESDVDLLVVHRENGTKAEQRKAIRKQLHSYRRSFDLHLYTPDELRALSGGGAGFVAHVLPEGVVLHAG